jgi:hypothetical protein
VAAVTGCTVVEKLDSIAIHSLLFGLQSRAPTARLCLIIFPNVATLSMLAQESEESETNFGNQKLESFAGKMNNLPKTVFSKTLQQVEWNNSRLV